MKTSISPPQAAPVSHERHAARTLLAYFDSLLADQSPDGVAELARASKNIRETLEATPGNRGDRQSMCLCLTGTRHESVSFEDEFADLSLELLVQLAHRRGLYGLAGRALLFARHVARRTKMDPADVVALARHVVQRCRERFAPGTPAPSDPPDNLGPALTEDGAGNLAPKLVRLLLERYHADDFDGFAKLVWRDARTESAKTKAFIGDLRLRRNLEKPRSRARGVPLAYERNREVAVSFLIGSFHADGLTMEDVTVEHAERLAAFLDADKYAAFGLLLFLAQSPRPAD